MASEATRATRTVTSTRRKVEATAVQEQSDQAGGGAPDTLERTLDRAFLSPRVVDQRSFEEFAGELRTLARDALSQGRALQASAAEVRQLREQLKNATAELTARVERGAAVVPSIDERLGRVEKLTDSVTRELAARLREYRQALEGVPPVPPAGTPQPDLATIVGAAVEAELARRLPMLQAQVEALVKQHAAGPIVTEAEAALAGVRAQAHASCVEASTARETLEASARQACLELGAAIAEGERRAQRIADEIVERARAGAEGLGQRREAAGEGAMSPDQLIELVSQAQRTGDALAALVDRAERVGTALDALVRRVPGNA